jgi:hypothetical protein
MYVEHEELELAPTHGDPEAAPIRRKALPVLSPGEVEPCPQGRHGLAEPLDVPLRLDPDVVCQSHGRHVTPARLPVRFDWPAQVRFRDGDVIPLTILLNAIEELP